MILYFVFLIFLVHLTKADEVKCEKYKLPKTGSCSLTIDWRVRNDKEALSTCLEYFPTTFVTATVDNNLAKCTVKAAYQCMNVKVRGETYESYPMFDKCYYFPKGNNIYKEETIEEYAKLCGDSGKIAVFYSYTHAKFVGMKANMLGIGKIWVGITRDGKEIQGNKHLLHSKILKLSKDDYWEGDQLKKCPVNEKNEPTCPDDAKYIFMRTRTDHIHNRVQGNFEQATETTKAFGACEIEAKYLSDQAWYCDKLKHLNFDAVYDEKSKNKRCLYVSASKHTFDAKHVKQFKGCKERPTQDLHSAGLDDGTADSSVYAKFASKNILRLSGYRMGQITSIADKEKQIKCQGPAPDSKTRQIYISKWRRINHFGKEKFAESLPWTPQYPLNECSDFPSDSSTLAIKQGQLVDVPPEVRLHAVCSIGFYTECENLQEMGKKPCKNEMKECSNVDEYNEDAFGDGTGGFHKCACPEKHIEADQDTTCKWDGPTDACGYAKYRWVFWKSNWKATYEPTADERKNTREDDGYILKIGQCGGETCQDNRFDFSYGTSKKCEEGNRNFYHGYYRTLCNPVCSYCNDNLVKVVVRAGCRMTIYSHGHAADYKHVVLVPEVKYGTYDVPNYVDDTLAGEWSGMAATSAKCICP